MMKIKSVIFAPLLVLFFLSLPGTSGVQGAEDWQRFLRGLTNRGYYDMAIQYLEHFRNNPECPAALASELDFRIGILTLATARTLPASQRVNVLERCQKNIVSFLSSSPEHPSAGEAWAALAHLYRDEGKEFLKQSQEAQEAAQQTLKGTAREQFARARQFLDKANQFALDQARSFQQNQNKDGTDAQQAYAFYLKMKIESASLAADSARTWNKDSDNYKTGLEQAQGELREIYEKYINYAGAYNARYLEATILDELGKTDEAIGILSQLVLTASDPVLNVLKTRSLLALGEIFQRRQKPEENLKFASCFYEWKNTTPLPQEFYVSSEGLQIHLIAARAFMQLQKEQTADRAGYNKMLKAFFPEQNTPFARLVLTGARMNEYALEQLRFVRSQRSSMAIEAQKLLKDPLFGGKEESSSDTNLLANNFEDASVAAQRGWESLIESTQEGRVPDKGTANTSEEKWNEVEQLFRHALRLADSTVPADKINQLRFQWSSFCFLAKRYEEAAVISNSLCRIPEFGNASKAARIALFSLRQMYALAKEARAKQETFDAIDTQVDHLVQYIDKRWGQSPTGERAAVVQDALVVRIDTAIAAGEVTRAEKLLSQVPDSTARTAAQLQLGISLWNAYTKRIAEKSEDSPKEDAQTKDFLEKARTNLETALKQKLSRSEVQGEDYFTVYSVLSLAQILLTQGHAAEALNWLSHPIVGPLNIVEHSLGKQKESANTLVDNPFAEGNFQLAVLVVALRCRVELAQYAEAQKIMQLLENTNSGENDKLLAVYVQLGRQLEQQLRETSQGAKSGNPEMQKRLKEISSGFEQFLDRISAQSNGNTYTTLRWVADTFLSLARGIAGTITETPKEALDYYTKAGRTYQTILKQIADDPAWAGNTNAKLTTSVRLIECLRGTGRYDGAIRVLVPLLKENENNLDLQIEGAKIYQDRGRLDKEYYITAIIGSERLKNGQNLLWGWNRIITRLAKFVHRDQRYKELFYDACLNKLICRYLYSRRLADKDDIVKHAKEGESEILRLYQTYPDLGGPASRRKLEDHLKRLRQQQGIENPHGFDSAS